ncbi:DUF3732 domain-containing protein [Flagellimonas okinawensis]|uniref:DUF3732 domain-containing protein n=1 Tax=Flagellimonas okinawensis TaxID=3031324 RepID=A0ABT5XP33_9FLAO|nr:DUF3732 domain-containing protein [[Muricauda] okinawensis]MDF0707659.1 DUF3732 domain-containing protein [[Muricauda] okinawensis]
MQLKIKNIILYPESIEKKPRVISFDTKKLNVITGYSQRGKSAIIDIVDYCLGSGECNIPVGKIRDSVSVYALYLELNDEFYFLARENYELSKSTMYFFKENVKGENLDLRSNKWLANKSEYKVSIAFVKKQLSELAGFKNYTVEDQNNPFNTSASFRDTAAFQFQTQNIIANPSTMFYKTDSWEHLQKLKTIFPLILGYSSYDIILLENEISELERQKTKLVNTLENLKEQYENWQGEVYKYYSEAVSLGLTNSDIDIQTASVSRIRTALNTILMSSKKGELYKKGSANRFNEKTNELINNRDSLIRTLNISKNNLNKIEQLEQSKDDYLDDVIREKENRLRPVEWFLEQNGTNFCPFCDSESTKAMDELLSLNEVRKANREIIDQAKSLSYDFEKEKKTLTQEISKYENSITQLDANLNILLKEEKEAEQSLKRTFEYVGKIEHALSNLKKIEPSSELNKEIEVLNGNIASKKTSLKKLNEKFDKESSLKKLTKLIGKYVAILSIESKENRLVHLDPDNSLNIKIEDTKTKNRYYLARLGSGANYMGYHLATMFGLHEFFWQLKKSNKVNYIPSFLILDQPSQVYYPESLNSKTDKLRKNSKDVEDTKKIFEACVEFLKNTGNEIQLILLEHVPKDMWSDIDPEYINLVEEWRGTEGNNDFKALIPQEW